MIETAESRSLTRAGQILALKLAFLTLAFASFLLSVYLYFVADEKIAAIFVAIWIPSIHSLGTLLMSGHGDLR